MSELHKAAIYILALIGGIVFITWLINWTLNWMPTLPTESVFSGADINLPFNVGDRVINDYSSDEVPKGAIGTISGTPLTSDDCASGRYKVDFDAYPRKMAPNNYWCELPTNIVKKRN